MEDDASVTQNCPDRVKVEREEGEREGEKREREGEKGEREGEKRGKQWSFHPSVLPVFLQQLLCVDLFVISSLPLFHSHSLHSECNTLPSLTLLFSLHS